MEFSFKWCLFLAKIQFRRKVSSLISLCGLQRLIWDDTLRTCILPCFLRTRHICFLNCTFAVFIALVIWSSDWHEFTFYYTFNLKHRDCKTEGVRRCQYVFIFIFLFGDLTYKQFHSLHLPSCGPAVIYIIRSIKLLIYV